MALDLATRRRLAHGSNATLMSLLVVAALVVSYLIVDRYRVRIDVSADQSSMLLEDTRNKLRLLDQDAQPVTITAFSAQEGRRDAYCRICSTSSTTPRWR